jgi:hypothetical protein
MCGEAVRLLAEYNSAMLGCFHCGEENRESDALGGDRLVLRYSSGRSATAAALRWGGLGFFGAVTYE